MKAETRLVHFDRCPDDPHRPSSTPIYQTATFEQEEPDRFGQYDYSRSGNPTRAVLEAQLAALESGQRAFAFASGMAAIAAVARLPRPGERVVLGADLYGGTFRLFDRLVKPMGVDVVLADTTEPAALDEAVTDSTRLVWIETPSNPLQRVTDLAAAATIAHRRGAWLAVDNTMMSPLAQRPLEFGADFVVHSATKFLCGHGDVTAGAVVCRDDHLAERIAFVQNAEGSALGPFDSWLLLRGLKTLHVRLKHAASTARHVAAFLEGHPLVRRVLWVGRDGHPGAAIHFAQASIAPPVISFEAASAEVARRVVASTRLFQTAVSFGSVGSSISLPACMSHASVPTALRDVVRVGPELVRVSVGLEDAQDLIDDLAAALDEPERPIVNSRRVAEPVVAAR